MQKHYLSSVLLLILMAAGQSMRAETALFVHQKSGGTTEYSFAEKPVVTYSEGCLVISAEEASVMFPLSNVQKFTFGEVDDQVTRITSPAGTLPQPTYIYNVGGILMRCLQPGADGTTSASLDGLPAGTYVIKNGKTSYKVIKK